MNWDSAIAPWVGLVKAALPRLHYQAVYEAKVVSQSPDLATLDVAPSDPRLPTMKVPFRSGLYGSRSKIFPGKTVLLTWANADPSKAFCFLPEGGEHVASTTIDADLLNLGGADGAEFTLKAESYRKAEAEMNATLISTFTALAGAATGPLAPLAAGFTAIAQAIQKFEGNAAGYLATIARVK